MSQDCIQVAIILDEVDAEVGARRPSSTWGVEASLSESTIDQGGEIVRNVSGDVLHRWYSVPARERFRKKTDLICEENGEVEPVAVDTLPGQPERRVRTRGRHAEWLRDLLLAALISPSLGTIRGKDSVGKGRGNKGKDEGDSTHCGGYWEEGGAGAGLSTGEDKATKPIFFSSPF